MRLCWDLQEVERCCGCEISKELQGGVQRFGLPTRVTCVRRRWMECVRVMNLVVMGAGIPREEPSQCISRVITRAQALSILHPPLRTYKYFQL